MVGPLLGLWGTGRFSLGRRDPLKSIHPMVHLLMSVMIQKVSTTYSAGIQLLLEPSSGSKLTLLTGLDASLLLLPLSCLLYPCLCEKPKGKRKERNTSIKPERYIRIFFLGSVVCSYWKLEVLEVLWVRRLLPAWFLRLGLPSWMDISRKLKRKLVWLGVGASFQNHPIFARF